MSNRAPTAWDARLEVLQCPYCQTINFHADGKKIGCLGCRTEFPVVAGVINTLVRPSPEVAKEIQGTIDESKEEFDSLIDFVVHRVEKISTQEERKAITRQECFNYHGSTEQHLNQVLEMISIRPGSRVLEIGGHDDYAFLVPFRDAGCECYETNIYFVYDDDKAFIDWPAKVAGDMNALPYKNNSFDIVFASATTHHSPDLEATIREMARVTKPGGIIFNINEPIGGWFKHAFDTRGERNSNRGRNASIHENEYSITLYRKCFYKYGLDIISAPFPAYYEEKLDAMETAGVRLGKVAKLTAQLWQFGPAKRFLKRYGLYWGQVLIGLQMNVILRKRHRNRFEEPGPTGITFHQYTGISRKPS